MVNIALGIHVQTAGNGTTTLNLVLAHRIKYGTANDVYPLESIATMDRYGIRRSTPAPVPRAPFPMLINVT